MGDSMERIGNFILLFYLFIVSLLHESFLQFIVLRVIKPGLFSVYTVFYIFSHLQFLAHECFNLNSFLCKENFIFFIDLRRGHQIRYSTHGVSLFISEYLGVAHQNLSICVSTQLFPIDIQRGAVYIVYIVTIVTEFFNIVKRSLSGLFLLAFSYEGFQRSGVTL